MTVDDENDQNLSSTATKGNGGTAAQPSADPPKPKTPDIRDQFMKWWSGQQRQYNLLVKQEEALRSILREQDPIKFQERYTNYIQGLENAMGPEYASIVKDLAKSSALMQGGGEALRYIEDMDAKGLAVTEGGLTKAAIDAARGQNVAQNTVGAFICGFLAGGGVTSGLASDGASFAQKAFQSEQFGVGSTLFGNSATGVKGLLNQSGSFLKAGWSKTKFTEEQGGGMTFRIGVGTDPSNTNRAFYHLDFGFVPNSVANPTISSIRASRNTGGK